MMNRRAVAAIVFVVLLGMSGAPPMAQEAQPPSFTILLANDDGYEAPGLKALADALSSVAELVVAAPASEQSGTGHGITYRHPIMVRRIRRADGIVWYAIQARPATCVRLALEALMDEKPDLVISGINRGANLGIVTFYSGTVAAAREAAFVGLPAIAVSMGGHDDADYRATAAFVRRLVQGLRSRRLMRPGLLLNVNVPAGIAHRFKGVRVTRLSLKVPGEDYERRVSPRGQMYFWNIYHPVKDDVEGTDVHAFARGFISLTPLGIDQTRTADLDVFRPLAQSFGARAVHQ